jgi:hypothetical protein
MRAAKLQELDEMAAKLLAIARNPSSGADRSNISRDRKISFANNCSAKRRFTASTPRAEGEGEMTSRDIPLFLAILACVLVATALTGWLSMRAIDDFLPGG